MIVFPRFPFRCRAAALDASINLQQVLHRIYDAAGYAYHIYNGHT